MFGFLRRIVRWIRKQVTQNYVFRGGVRERLCRQEFFYNAFRALSFNGIDGDYAEFGSYGGMTFALAYHESRRHGHRARCWAFDSFQGLPAPKEAKDEHPVWVEGQMATSVDQFHAICTSNKIPRDAYSVVPGFYDQTLAKMSPKDAPDNIALAYIDCDLYSSTKIVLEFLMPRMKHGMIIAFDDYFCWSRSQTSGERKAMLEFFSKNDRWQLVPYMQFGWHGNSFVVEDERVVNQ
ncbi:MAG: TylF/MycF/NovP-related O-methyltransferase [bacterium]